MIEYRNGDIFDSGAEALVNAVNCMGVMGKGLALEFKNRYPLNYTDYRELCKSKGLTPGDLHITKFPSEPLIINFATKNHWKNRSWLSWIDRGCRQLRIYLQATNLSSIAIPALGCGLGGLAWSDVKKLLEEYFGDLDTIAIIYEPWTK